ncbi:MAG: metal-dependent hydrolase, partial [Proteobacteria bacterium]|nr:metal-dependent hydrolase [Pseudomonadota bacterium]
SLSLIKLIVVAIVFSNMPDIDQPGAKINKYVTIGLVGIIIWAFYTAQNTIGIVTAVILGLLRIIEHRTCIHSLLAAVIISAPLYYFGLIYFIVGFLAFVSHLLIDGEMALAFEKDWW